MSFRIFARRHKHKTTNEKRLNCRRTTQRGVDCAYLEEGGFVSLQKESRNQAYAVGDIYLAKVKKLMPGLNAAFVNVGYEKDAFLHYLDLAPTSLPIQVL